MASSSAISTRLDQLMSRFSIGEWRRDCDRLVSLIVLVTMLSVTPIGYHIIALNVPSGVIQNAIHDEFKQKYDSELSAPTMNVIWSFAVSCQSIGALIGCLFVVPMERRFGTKRSLLLINNLLMVAASLSFVAISPRTSVLFLLILGRLFVGLYTGIGCALVPIYIQELAPTQLRGALCCFVHIAICAGSALGAFLSLADLLGGPSTWTVLLSLPMLLALAQIFLGYFLRETPNFFLRKNDDMAAADSIRFHYSLADHLDTHTVIREYHSLVDKLPPQHSFWEVLQDQRVREQVLLGMACSVAQIFSGSMAAVSYSTSMLQSVSFTASLTPYIPTLGALLSILLTLPALRLVESCGRKRLLVNTLGICAAANFLLVIFSLLSQLFDHQQQHEQSWASLAFLLCFFVYGIGYNVGVGPVAYFLPAELVPANAISVSMGAATALNWFSSMVSTIIYYPLNELIGGWSFLLFAIPTTFFAILFYRKLPNGVDKHMTTSNGTEASSKNMARNSTPGGPAPTRTPANTLNNESSSSDDGTFYDGSAGAVDVQQKSATVGSGASLPTARQRPRFALEETPLQPQQIQQTGGGVGSDGTTASTTAWYSTFSNP